MLEDVVRRLEEASVIGLDFETMAIRSADHDLRQARLLGIGVAIDEPRPYAAYLDIGPTGDLIAEDAFDALRSIFQDESKLIIAHNARFERTILKLQDIDVDGHLVCTLIEAMLVDENRRLSLKCLVFQEFGEEQKVYANARKPGELFGADLGEICQTHARNCLRLHRLYQPTLEKQELWRYLMEIVMPSVELSSDMSLDGVRVDVDELTRLEGIFQKRIDELNQRAHDLLGRPINIAAPQEVAEALFEELKIQPPPGLRRGKTGHYSARRDVLRLVADQHELPGVVLDHRSVIKLLSTYIRPLRERALADDGRIRPDWKACMAETGRWRCANPNLQNIPKADEIRAIFVPEPGNVFIHADYNQLELRLAALYSEDENMVRIYQEDGDIHQMTQDSVGCDRRQAKIINFSLVYGMAAKALRLNLWRFTNKWVTDAQAEEFRNRFFRNYPGLLAYHRSIYEAIDSHGYVCTIAGRRRHRYVGQDRREAFQELVNAPIQGSAADIIGFGIAALRRELAKRTAENPLWSKAKILLQEHDEIDMGAPKEIGEECAQVLKDCMEATQPPMVAIKADIGIGNNWADAKG